nr:MAG TPA: hypothetical protein [Caudoviricetes sp.]
MNLKLHCKGRNRNGKNKLFLRIFNNKIHRTEVSGI